MLCPRRHICDVLANKHDIYVFGLGRILAFEQAGVRNNPPVHSVGELWTPSVLEFNFLSPSVRGAPCLLS